MENIYLNQFNPLYHYFGALCKRGHDHKDGMSIRQIEKNGVGNCIQCRKERFSKNLENKYKNLNTEISNLSKNFDNSLYYLSPYTPLCPKKHRYLNSNFSLRDKNDNGCIDCRKEKHNRLRIQNAEKKSKKEKEFDKKYEEVYKLFDNSIYYISSKTPICPYNHIYLDTGVSLRYINSTVCVECHKQMAERGTNKRNKQRKEDPQLRLDDSFSTSLKRALQGNKNNKSWETLVDYNLKIIKNHLLETLPSGFVFTDYGFKLNVDHIIPKTFFHYSHFDDEEFKLCWNLKNLQFLSRKDNDTKSNKYAGSPNKKIITRKEFLELKKLFPIKLLCNAIWDEYWD